MDEIFRRVSIRCFQNKPVEDDKVERLLRAAMAAPSACNQQPWEFYLVADSLRLAALAACSSYAGCLREAPLGIVVCSRRDCPAPEYAQIDCAAAVENLLLETVHQGLGAVWLGIAPLPARMEAARQVLELPDTLDAFAFIACGYPAEDSPQQNRYDPARVHRLCRLGHLFFLVFLLIRAGLDMRPVDKIWTFAVLPTLSWPSAKVKVS